MLPPLSLKHRVLDAVRHHPAPRRTDRLLPGIGLTALAALAMVAVVQWVPRVLGEVGGVAHAAGRPAASGAGIVAGTAALALFATWLVLRARRSMLSPPRGLLLAVALGVPALLGAWLTLWHGTYADPFTRSGWRCFAITVLAAPWPFAVLLYAGRRVEPRHPGTSGAALGAAAGVWATVALELWCPLADEAHVLLGHVLPLLAIALAGWAIGARMLRLRRV